MEVTRTERPALRAGMYLYGIGLGVLWIIGVATHKVTWFTWIDLVGAALGLYAATILPSLTTPAAVSSGLLFSLGIVALWIVGMVTRVAGWLDWISFALAALLFVMTMVPAARGVRRVTQE